MEWRAIVSYPETFNHQEAMLLDGVDPRIFAVLLGETKPETTEEKRFFVNCTKSLPSSDLEKALSKFYIQSRKRKNASPTEEPKRIDYDRLSSGSSHGDKKTRLREQKKDRYGDPYR